MTSPERSGDHTAIMLSAGEASGDLHDGILSRALREKDLRARLGEPGVGRRAARAVLDTARTG